MKIRTPLELGMYIRDARQAKDVSQSELAALLGTTQAWVSDLEKAKRAPGIDAVLRVFDALGIAMDLQDAAAPVPPAVGFDDIPEIDDLDGKDGYAP